MIEREQEMTDKWRTQQRTEMIRETNKRMKSIVAGLLRTPFPQVIYKLPIELYHSHLASLTAELDRPHMEVIEQLLALVDEASQNY